MISRQEEVLPKLAQEVISWGFALKTEAIIILNKVNKMPTDRLAVNSHLLFDAFCKLLEVLDVTNHQVPLHQYHIDTAARNWAAMFIPCFSKPSLDY